MNAIRLLMMKKIPERATAFFEDEFDVYIPQI